MAEGSEMRGPRSTERLLPLSRLREEKLSPEDREKSRDPPEDREKSLEPPEKLLRARLARSIADCDLFEPRSPFCAPKTAFSVSTCTEKQMIATIALTKHQRNIARLLKDRHRNFDPDRDLRNTEAMRMQSSCRPAGTLLRSAPR